MRRDKGFAFVYAGLIVVAIVVFGLLLAFMTVRPPGGVLCNDPYDHSCCTSIRDPCGEHLSCPENTCETEKCQELCTDSPGCILVGNNIHSCVSVECASDHTTCTPDECLSAPYRYNPETGKSMDGQDWWYYVSPGGVCCKVTVGGEKEC